MNRKIAMNRDEMKAAIRQAFIDAGAIYDTTGPANALITAADAYDHAAAQIAVAITEPQPDREFLDDARFEERLRVLMRRNPQLLEQWIRQRNRIHGSVSWLPEHP